MVTTVLGVPRHARDAQHVIRTCQAVRSGILQNSDDDLESCTVRTSSHNLVIVDASEVFLSRAEAEQHAALLAMEDD